MVAFGENPVKVNLTHHRKKINLESWPKENMIPIDPKTL
jgi:hypothetical protein